MKLDETKLTAYLLGEIKDPEQCRAIEKALAENPELQKQAEEMRTLQGHLQDAFQEESFTPAEFPGIPANFPKLNLEDERSSVLRWMPLVSGLAASVALVCAFILLDFGRSGSNGTPLVSDPTGSGLDPVALEEFDLSMIRSELLGPSATWSDSQVLARSPFYKLALESMILSEVQGTSVIESTLANSDLDDAFSSAFQRPYSQIPLFWDGFGMTRLELALGRGQLPEPQAVQVEALVNAIVYDYEPPEEPEEPFAVHMEQAESPWTEGQTLLRVGLQSYDKPLDAPRNSNWVFLVDVSGSMDESDKLPLVKAGLKTLAETMSPRDRMAIVTYGGSSSVHLPSTLGLDRDRILESIAVLEPGVGSDTDDGILEAYRIAEDAYMEEGNNRVVVCTDGDVMLGVRDSRQLQRTISGFAQRGITLSAYGFSVGPGRHEGIESLAISGDGGFGYIDSPLDVRMSFAGRLTGEVSTLARDVKLELEFNPEKVDSYRLIGFEESNDEPPSLVGSRPSRLEVAPGHTVTALYELIPSDILEDPKSKGEEIASLSQPVQEEPVAELVTVRVHYQPEGRTQEELIEVLFSGEASPFEEASDDLRFAAAVTGFGQILRNSPYKGDVDFNWVLSTAGGAVGKNSGGTRTQFLEMVRQAEAITKSDYSTAEK